MTKIYKCAWLLLVSALVGASVPAISPAALPNEDRSSAVALSFQSHRDAFPFRGRATLLAPAAAATSGAQPSSSSEPANTPPTRHILVASVWFSYPNNKGGAAPPPDRQFGRQVNCSGLLELVIADLTAAAQSVGAALDLSQLMVLNCSGSRFVTQVPLTLPAGACPNLDEQITGGLSYGGMLDRWHAYAMREQHNCSAYWGIHVDAAVYTFDIEMVDLDDCVAKSSGLGYCSRDRIFYDLPSPPSPFAPAARSPQPAPSSSPAPPSSSSSPSSSPSRHILAATVWFSFPPYINSSSPPDRQFGREVNCSVLLELVTADLTAAARQAGATLDLSQLKVLNCSSWLFQAEVPLTLQEGACPRLGELVAEGLSYGGMLDRWHAYAMRAKRNCSAYWDLDASAAVFTWDAARTDLDECVTRISGQTYCNRGVIFYDPPPPPPPSPPPLVEGIRRPSPPPRRRPPPPSSPRSRPPPPPLASRKTPPPKRNLPPRRAPPPPPRRV